MRRLLIILIALCVAGTAYSEDIMIFKKKAAGGAAPTYLVSESFDGASACGDNTHTNCDVTWTVAGDGTIDFNYATSPAPLVGSYSLMLEEATTDTTIYYEFGATSDPVSAYVLIHPLDFANIGTKWPLSFKSTGASILCAVQINANGTTNVATVYPRIGGTVGNALVTTMDAGTTYHVWLDYSNAADTCTVAMSTDGTKPTSGDGYSQATTPVSTNSGRIYLASDAADHQFIFDKVRVDDVEIGSNPQ